MSSLFQRVTRYPISPSLNPRENRLTEVTAAVLEVVPPLAREVVVELLRQAHSDAVRRAGLSDQNEPLAPEEVDRRAGLLARAETLYLSRVDVSTQVPTRHGRFVDLAFRLRPPVGSRGPELLLWVEVKHGARVHGNQLRAYVAEIDWAHVPDHQVILLAPRGDMVDERVPPEVGTVDWQRYRRWRRSRPLVVTSLRSSIGCCASTSAT